MKDVLCTVLSATLLFLSATALAGEHDSHGPSGVPEKSIGLSSELLQLLRQEMRLIEDGMMRLVPAIAAGNWDTVADVATTIRKSYIMKKRLTPEHRDEMHRHLPAAFVEIDHAFHDRAGRLAEVARQKKAELAVFHFYKMNESCVICHARFASQRFPGLVPLDSKQRP